MKWSTAPDGWRGKAPVLRSRLDSLRQPHCDHEGQAQTQAEECSPRQDTLGFSKAAHSKWQLTLSRAKLSVQQIQMCIVGGEVPDLLIGP
jgi:hypothetical protein